MKSPWKKSNTLQHSYHSMAMEERNESKIKGLSFYCHDGVIK